MLKAALRGLVDEAFDEAAANLTDKLFDLVTEPEDDDEIGELSDEELAQLH
jgi:hypothetical protein